VLDASDVECDQKHLHIFIDNYPQIPDRTTFLLKGGENPYPLILESAKNFNYAQLFCIMYALQYSTLLGRTVKEI